MIRRPYKYRLELLEFDKVKEAKTVSDLLIMNYGNQTDVANFLRVNRSTITKYKNEPGKLHRVIPVDGCMEMFTRKNGGVQ